VSGGTPLAHDALHATHAGLRALLLRALLGAGGARRVAAAVAFSLRGGR
jgi:hypothetical protein